MKRATQDRDPFGKLCPHLTLCEGGGFCAFELDRRFSRDISSGRRKRGQSVLNTEGTGVNTPELVRSIREIRPGLPVLHIGEFPIRGMPDDVANLSETFTPDDLLATVAARGGRAVLVPGLTSQAPTRLLNTVLHSRKHSDIT